MYAEDFVYDGVALSDYDFVIVNFDQSGLEVSDTGSKITMNLVSSNYGKHYDLAGSSYDACISCTFHICKNPDKFNMDEMAITSDEYRDIVRWLNRREFKKMQFISCCSEENMKEMPYYNATFNVNKMVLGEVVYGIELTMQTDSPFGYFDPVQQQFTMDNGTTTFSNNSARYAVKLLDAGGSEVNTAYASDLKLRASKAEVAVGPSYGEDGNALNYTGDIHDLTLVPEYDASSSEVAYQVEDVSFSTVMDADETNLLATDMTAASSVLYKEYETIGTSFTGSATTFSPTATITSSDNIATHVYENVLGRDLADGETFIVSMMNNGGNLSYTSWSSSFTVSVEVYGEVNGEEVVAARFTAGDGFEYSRYISAGNWNYNIIRGVKLRKSDIPSWQDRGVYRIRVIATRKTFTGLSTYQFTVLSREGSQTFNFVSSGQSDYDYSDCIRYPTSGRSSLNYANYMYTYSTASSGSYPVLYSDGLAWYRVYDTGELSGSSSSTNADTLEPIAYRSREIALASGRSAIFTNVFSGSGKNYGASLVRKVTNGSNTYTQTEILDVQQGSEYIHYGPMPYSISAVPNAYTTSGSFGNSNYSSAIGQGSDTTDTSSVTYCSATGSYATVYYSFDFSSIPEGATIDSMALTVKGRAENTSASSGTNAYLLYVIDANGVQCSDDALFSSSTEQVVTLSIYDGWTRESLIGAKLCFKVGYYGGAVSGATWVVNYSGAPNGERNDTRDIVHVVANYDDDFFSSYGNTYTRSAYIEYSYDLASTVNITDVQTGSPVGLLRGNGGENYDGLPTAVYGTNSVYKAYQYPRYVYFDNDNGYVYVSDGILWKRMAIVTNAYYTTEKFPIGDGELLTCYAEYTSADKDRTIYRLAGTDNGDMEVIGSQTFASGTTYVYGSVSDDAFTDYTSGQRYVQFRYPLSGLILSGVKISKVSAATSDADIILGYSQTMTTTTARSSITSAHIVTASQDLYSISNLNAGTINGTSGQNVNGSYKQTRARTSYIKVTGTSSIVFLLDLPDYEWNAWTYRTATQTSANRSLGGWIDGSIPVQFTPQDGDVYVRFAFRPKDNHVLTTDLTDPTSDWSILCGAFSGGPAALTYNASDNTHKLFVNTYNRYLYISDGAMWYYYGTVDDSGNRMSLAIALSDAAYISCGAEFSSASTKTGYFSLEDSNGGSFTTSEESITSTSSVRYTADFTSGSGQAYLTDAADYDKYLRYIYDGDNISSAVLTIMSLSSGNNGVLHVASESWTTGQATSVGSYAASGYPGYLALSASTNLYFSDGSHWFYVMDGVREDEYATTRLDTAAGDIITFSVDFGEETTFVVKKVEYGTYGGKVYFSTTSSSFTSVSSGVCVSDDDTFTVGTITVNRQGVYFIFPWTSGCSYTVTKVYSGTPTGILTGSSGVDYDGTQSISGGSGSAYLASDYPYYLYVDRANNYLYVSDGAFWHYVKTTQAGRYATSSVPVSDGEMVTFYVTYPHSKAFTVTKEIIASCEMLSDDSVTDSYNYSSTGTTLALAASYSDTELVRYGAEYAKSVRFIYPYETGVSVSVRKIYVGNPNGVITAIDDPEYGYNQISGTGDKTITYTPHEDDDGYPAATYLSYVYCNSGTGDMYVSDGTYWWFVKNAVTSDTNYYIRSATLSASAVSGSNRVARVDQIDDDDIIILNVSYPDEQTFTVQVTRGLTSTPSAAVTTTYSYAETTNAILRIRATDAAFIGSESSDGRYVQFMFPDGDAEWAITKATAGSDSPSNIVYGYHGDSFDGMSYVEDDYASNGSTKYYTSEYAYSMYMDEANGYVYASDGMSWHYLTTTNTLYRQGTFVDISDEIGYSYPDVIVTIEEDGRYVLQNETYGTSTEINNCSAGEVITMHGRTQTIETSLAVHDIAKDFNFEFLRIGNTYSSRENIIKYRLPATTTIIHTPLAKDLT